MSRWLAAGLVSFGPFLALGLAVARQPLGIGMSVAGAFTGLWRGELGRVTTIVSHALGLVLPAVHWLTDTIGAVLGVLGIGPARECAAGPTRIGIRALARGVACPL